jgi:hypothetical protein
MILGSLSTQSPRVTNNLFASLADDKKSKLNSQDLGTVVQNFGAQISDDVQIQNTPRRQSIAQFKRMSYIGKPSSNDEQMIHSTLVELPGMVPNLETNNDKSDSKVNQNFKENQQNTIDFDTEQDEIERVSMFDPVSNFRVTWTVSVLIFSLLVIVVSPFRFCFMDHEFYALDAIMWTVDVFFVVDYILKYGFFWLLDDEPKKDFSNENYETSSWKLNWKNHRFSMVIDMLEVFPLDLIIALFCDSSEFWFVVSSVRMMKMLRIFQVREYLDNVLNHFVSQTSVLGSSVTRRTIRIVLYLIIAAHVFACFWYFIGMSELKQQSASWLSVSWGKYFSTSVENYGIREKYSISFYFAIVTITSVGYGDITATTVTEAMFCILIMSCGIVTLTNLIGGLVPIFADLSAGEERLAKDTEVLNRYMASRNISTGS